MSGPILGAVLAGGASSRFGSDKALAMVGGRTLLDRARAALAVVTQAVVIVGRADGIPDLPIPGMGPLGGLAGALDHARRRGLASVMTIGCDMPEVPAVLLAMLRDRLPSYCADAPVFGHWPVAVTDELLVRLASVGPSPGPHARLRGLADRPVASDQTPRMPDRAGHDEGRARRHGLSVRRWAFAIGAVPVPSPVPLANVNTPADLPG